MRLTEAELQKVREYWRGSSAFLGAPDAERDVHATRNWLQSLFVQSAAINKITSGSARIVVGRKGSGKSAARLAAEQMFAGVGTQKPYVLSASADAVLADHGDELRKAQLTGAVHVWFKAFAYQILKAVAANLSGKPLTGHAEVTLRKWSLDQGFAAKDFGERIVAGAVRCIPRVRKHLAKEKTTLSEEHIRELLTGRNTVLYIDDFDNLYSPHGTGVPVAQIRAALEAADRLTVSSGGPTVTLLLREDLWLLCRHGWHYLDKVSGVVDLLWDEASMRQFIERRIQSAVDEALGDHRPLSFADLWEVFFPGRISLEDDKSGRGFGFVLRRTLYTPRDLQGFLLRVSDAASRWPATHDDVVTAERNYSRDRTEFMINEFGSLCRGLATCIYSFSAKPMEMKPSDLYKHLKGLIGSGDVQLADAMKETDEELALARFLFRIGFLEVRYPEVDRFEVRDALRHPDHWKGIRRDDTVRWAVRSVFYRVLESHRKDPVGSRTPTPPSTEKRMGKRLSRH